MDVDSILEGICDSIKRAGQINIHFEHIVIAGVTATIIKGSVIPLEKQPIYQGIPKFEAVPMEMSQQPHLPERFVAYQYLGETIAVVSGTTDSAAALSTALDNWNVDTYTSGSTQG